MEMIDSLMTDYLNMSKDRTQDHMVSRFVTLFRCDEAFKSMHTERMAKRISPRETLLRRETKHVADHQIWFFVIKNISEK